MSQWPTGRASTCLVQSSVQCLSSNLIYRNLTFTRLQNDDCSTSHCKFFDTFSRYDTIPACNITYEQMDILR